LNADVYRILYPTVEYEKRFEDACQSLARSEAALQEYEFVLNTTFEDIQRQADHFKRLIDQRCNNGNYLLKQAILEFINEITDLRNQTKSTKMMELLKKHVNETVIEPFIEKICERKMDLNDDKLIEKFTKAITHIQQQQHRT
jgi:hypothetical protein